MISFSGLSVEIFLDQSNYMRNKLSKQAGVKIVVHDPNNPPSPDEIGFVLRPNTAGSIAIQKTIFSRLPHPYTSKCMDSWEETGLNVTTGSTYSQTVIILKLINKLLGVCFYCYIDIFRAAKSTACKKILLKHASVFILAWSNQKQIQHLDTHLV